MPTPPPIPSRLLRVTPALLGLSVAAAAAEPVWPDTGPGWRSAALVVDTATRPGFRLLGPELTGVTFTNHLSELAGASNRVLENGSGVAAGDFDGDTWPDLFLCGLGGNSALYRNLGGWKFRDVTTAAGLDLQGEVCRGAVLADLNGDRRPDLLVSTLARGVRCFINTGGRFRDATAEAGLGGTSGSTTLALADVDGNGTPDLYVTRYRAEDIRDTSLVEARRVGGRTELHPKYAGRLVVGQTGLIEFGEPDVLYLNDGQAQFREVPWTGGAFLDEDGHALETAPRDWGLTASFRDINGDGLPDLYVCNDYWTPDRLWLNAGGGRFRLAPRTTLRHTSENSMGVDFADVDRDGWLDILVLDMLDPDPRNRRRQALAQTPMPPTPGEIANRPQVMRNTFHRGRADGTFAEIAEYAGLGASGWSWQPLFLDVDLDGFEDVLIPSGHRRDVQDLDATERIRQLQHPWPGNQDPRARQEAFTREMLEHGRLYPPLPLPIGAFRNLGGFRFTNATATWGLNLPGIHQGMALADLDRDGDLDAVANNLNAAAGLHRNDAPGPRIAVRLRGAPPNSEGIGARVRLLGGAVPIQSQEIVAGGRYLSGHEPLLTFAPGRAPGALSIEVLWRGGRTSSILSVRPDRLYEIDESATPAPTNAPAGRPPVPQVTPVEPLFEDISSRLAHVHHEDAFDDFASQPLLHRRLSQGGPGIALVDLDTNDWPDLVIGTGAGGHPAVFTNDTRGGLGPAPRFLGVATPSVDLTGLVTLRAPDGRAQLLAGTGTAAGNDPGATNATFLTLAPNPAAAPSIPPTPNGGGSTGPLALGDLDGDGHLELFTGGGPVRGRYPEAAASQVFRHGTHGWRRDEANTAVLRDVGLVNGAVWGDLDGDGDGDLVLACEWSAIRVFRSDVGRLVDVTRAWGLDAFTGWWLGVTLGDIDGDGRLDLVAGNWGLNSATTARADRPAVLVHGDLLDRGTVDLLEGEWDPVRGSLMPRRRLDELEAALPPIRTLFPTHRAFVDVTLDNLVRAFGRDVRRLEARTLASTVFFNRSGRFEAVPLPAEAQYSPVSGVLVADFDGDGLEDVFLAQNCFALPWHLQRLDAGRGLLLRGTGAGRLEPLDSAVSGIRIDGEQRGAAFGDVDRDGRLDLFVGQNAAGTKWYRNRRAIPGLRIRLDAGPGNPDGIGAVVRIRQTAGFGPARPVLAGSGWWSQSSPELVMARPPGLTTLSVRWPGGRTTEVLAPAATAEIRIDPESRRLPN